MKDLDYNGPIEIEKGIYWIGYVDDLAGLHCNPYLIVEGDEAVLIDAGSRDDFSAVMMKILQTGTNPNQIQSLIYQHYDPDLCGSIPHFENLIKNDNLKILSHRENNIFIKYYSSKRPKECIETINYSYEFKTGREITFIRTPYCHSTGSFMTYDSLTGTLFSSDIFGSYDRRWELYLELIERCGGCGVSEHCKQLDTPCEIKGIIDFNKRIMTSTKALKYALRLVEDLKPKIVAPQHGSIIVGEDDIRRVIQQLKNADDVGIDGYLKEMGYDEF